MARGSVPPRLAWGLVTASLALIAAGYAVDTLWPEWLNDHAVTANLLAGVLGLPLSFLVALLVVDRVLQRERARSWENTHGHAMNQVINEVEAIKSQFTSNIAWKNQEARGTVEKAKKALNSVRGDLGKMGMSPWYLLGRSVLPYVSSPMGISVTPTWSTSLAWIAASSIQPLWFKQGIAGRFSTPYNWGRFAPEELQTEDIEALKSIPGVLKGYSVPKGVIQAKLDRLCSTILPRIDDLEDPDIILSAREYKDKTDEWTSAVMEWQNQDGEARSKVIDAIAQLQEIMDKAKSAKSKIEQKSEEEADDPELRRQLYAPWHQVRAASSIVDDWLLMQRKGQALINVGDHLIKALEPRLPARIKAQLAKNRE